MYHGLEYLVQLFLFTCFAAGTDYSTECAEKDTPDLVFEPSGPVVGRYSLKWCADITGKVLNQQVYLYAEKIPKASCDKEKHISKAHSYFEADDNEVFNCSSRVCFLGSADLVYAGCYNLMYKVLREDAKCAPLPSCVTSGTYVHYVENNYTAENFTRSVAIAHHQSHGDISVVTFSYGNFPVTDFKVELYNESIPGPESQCNTTRDACLRETEHIVRCEWRLAPGHYSAVLTHLAPWTHGSAPPPREHVTHFQHVAATPAPRVSPPRTLTSSLSWSAAAAAALLVAAAAVGAVLVRRRRARGAGAGGGATSAVPNDTLECGPLPRPRARPADPADPADILLLYARDSQPLCDAMRELRALLQQTSKGQVHDLYSAATVSLLATDAAGWVRVTLRRARTLLVLTPYLALNVTQYDDNTQHLERCLLGSRVVYREPMFGDQLLSVALTELQRACDTGDLAEYERLVVAEFSGRPTELCGALTALTRYSLPADLAPLVARLTGGDGGGDAGAGADPSALARVRGALAACGGGGDAAAGRLQPINWHGHSTAQ